MVVVVSCVELRSSRSGRCVMQAARHPIRPPCQLRSCPDQAWLRPRSALRVQRDRQRDSGAYCNDTCSPLLLHFYSLSILHYLLCTSSVIFAMQWFLAKNPPVQNLPCRYNVISVQRPGAGNRGTMRLFSRLAPTQCYSVLLRSTPRSSSRARYTQHGGTAASYYVLTM